MLRKLPPFTRNFYFIIGVLFIFWMLFVDSDNFISQYKLIRKESNLKAQKAFYQEKIIEVQKDRSELLTDDEMLEKFAREKYLMKKDNEDVYIVVEETE